MIEVPISTGELIDKLSILRVKKTKITNKEKLEFINKEFEIGVNCNLDDEDTRKYIKMMEKNGYSSMTAAEASRITKEIRFKKKIEEYGNGAGVLLDGTLTESDDPNE